MAAEADDLRYFYGAALGPSVEVSLSDSTARSEKLDPGRYIVRLRGVATAVRVWLRQGKATVSAATSTPSTPFEIGGSATDAASVRALNSPLCEIHVRGGESADDYVAGILDAGTATLVLTKVSRYRS